MAALRGETEKLKMPYDHENAEARGIEAAQLLLKKNKPANKREVKQLEKEKEIVRLYQVERMKPRDIAKRMRVSSQVVYKYCHTYLARVKRFQEGGQENDSSVINRAPLDQA